MIRQFFRRKDTSGSETHNPKYKVYDVLSSYFKKPHSEPRIYTRQPGVTQKHVTKRSKHSSKVVNLDEASFHDKRCELTNISLDTIPSTPDKPPLSRTRTYPAPDKFKGLLTSLIIEDIQHKRALTKHQLKYVMEEMDEHEKYMIIELLNNNLKHQHQQ
jgi:hypothetical protein